MSDRSEENRLVEQVRHARRRIADEYHRTIILDGELHQAQGEIYVAGVWVPMHLIDRVSRRLRRSALVGLVEFHLAVLVALGLLVFIWVGVEWFLLP